MPRLAWLCGLAASALLLTGCQPAGRFEANPSKRFAAPAPPPPAPAPDSRRTAESPAPP
jgi:hypothetical protein